MQKELINKLTRKQLFTLSILGLLCFVLMTFIVAMLAPSALPSLFGILG